MCPRRWSLYIKDNLVGACSKCQQPVQYRPHAPRPHILICMQCVDFDPDRDTMSIPPRMIEDVVQYILRKKLQ
jgi:hypothetical protein